MLNFLPNIYFRCETILQSRPKTESYSLLPGGAMGPKEENCATYFARSPEAPYTDPPPRVHKSEPTPTCLPCPMRCNLVLLSRLAPGSENISIIRYRRVPQGTRGQTGRMTLIQTGLMTGIHGLIDVVGYSHRDSAFPPPSPPFAELRVRVHAIQRLHRSVINRRVHFHPYTCRMGYIGLLGTSH